MDGSEIGLTLENFLTPQLASFLALNERTIRSRLPLLFSEIRRYRRMLNMEASAKLSTLSYDFLGYAYEQPSSPSLLLSKVEGFEIDLAGKIMQMMQTNNKNGSLRSVDERMKVVTRFPATVWWYLFWVRTRTILSHTLLSFYFSGRFLASQSLNHQIAATTRLRLRSMVSNFDCLSPPSPRRTRCIFGATRDSTGIKWLAIYPGWYLLFRFHQPHLFPTQ